MLPALITFAVTYLLMIFLPKYRAYVALASAALFVISGTLPLGDVLTEIDWNVILMITGTMGIVDLFIESGMPSRLADMILNRVPDVKWAIIALSVFAGFISAFVDNVATVLMVAPVAITISKKLEISPVPSVIAIAIASNLQGAATLVGDTTSIMLGSYANMDFLDFFWMNGRPGMFWIEQIGMVAATAVLLWVFRGYRQKIGSFNITEVRNYFPTYLLLGTVILLILASFIPEKPAATNGIICISLMIIGIIYEMIRQRKTAVFKKTIMGLDYFTILLLASLCGNSRHQARARAGCHSNPLTENWGKLTFHPVHHPAVVLCVVLCFYRQYSLCGHNAPCGVGNSVEHECGPQPVLLWPAGRGNSGRQPNSHRSLGKYYGYRNSPEARL